MVSKIRFWLSRRLHHAESTGRGSIAQRFGIPHDFAPDLSLPEALIRVVAALARIVLGSLLFAVWGVYSARAWGAISNHFWRATAILPLVLLFSMLFTALMAGISAIVKTISTKRH